MKIVHICVNGPFTEGWGYQENLLAKYHALAGHEVTVIAGQEKHLPSGEIVQAPCGETVLEDKVRLVRVAASRSGLPAWRRAFARHDVLPLLARCRPDLVMIHGMVGDVSALQVKRFVQRESPATRVVADIHQDYYNTVFPTNACKKRILRLLHRYMNGKMYSIYRILYYTRPCRRTMAHEYYGAPLEKLSFLPMGCDPEEITGIEKDKARQSVRNEYGFEPEDIIVCHGGKLDARKKTVELIKAVKSIQTTRKDLKLIVFGSAAAGYEQEIVEAIGEDDHRIKMAGYQNQKAYYRLFAAADIAVFPGTHSVLWEQAVASGLAVIAHSSSGESAYLDVGGNVSFIGDGDEKTIETAIRSILDNGAYRQMKHVAETHGFQYFSYREIARRVIDEAMA